jgi:hypothetical protein
MRKILITFAALAFATLGLAAPSAASASAAATQSSVLGCQPASATLQYLYRTSSGGTGVWTRNCSGNYTLNSQGIRLEAGGWSGYVRFNNGTSLKFCDWNVINLSNRPRVIRIDMAVTSVC